MLDRAVLPRLGKLRVIEVTHQDIQKLYIQLQDTPCQANRTLALLSKKFELSIRWGMHSDNPARGIEKRHEENASAGSRTRVWIVCCWPWTTIQTKSPTNAIRLQLLTVARIGEVLSAKWSDFDLERRVWTKSSHHTKQKRREHLPLSSATCALLEEINGSRERECAWLFPGCSPNRLYKISRRFRGLLPRPRRWKTTAFTTIAIRTPRILFPAV